VLLASLLACFAFGPLARAAQPSPAMFKEKVLPMKIADGDPDDPGRVFSIPVTCNAFGADFELGCYGSTRVSVSFAKRAGVPILPDPTLDRVRDPDDKPIFAGSGTATIEIGGQEREVRVSVMKDEFCQKPEREGMIGFDVLRDFQWEVDPGALTFTLRPATTVPAKKPLAILPLRVGDDGYYLKVRIRNVTQDLGLMPGSSFIQAGLRLQRAWDLSSGEKIKTDNGRFGDVRTTWLRGDDGVDLARNLHETDLPVALMGDAKKRKSTNMLDSGLGQCVLNRFVYCVEPRRQQFRIMARVPTPKAPSAPPTTAPARKP